jgi:hypothetical protein
MWTEITGLFRFPALACSGAGRPARRWIASGLDDVIVVLNAAQLSAFC